MTAAPSKIVALWKVVWVICPLTYLLAIATFALIGFITDQAGGKTTVLIGGQSVETVTAQWFQYAWYQSVAVQSVALAHAAFCFFIIFRYRRNTAHVWFKISALVLALAYIAYVGYFAYQFFNPDPSIRPISDHF